MEVLQPEERERKNSKVQFKESTEVIVELRVRMGVKGGGRGAKGGVKGVLRGLLVCELLVIVVLRDETVYAYFYKGCPSRRGITAGL